MILINELAHRGTENTEVVIGRELFGTMEINELSYSIIESSIKIHKTLGPGLLEKVYEATLQYELKNKGLFVERQKVVPIHYEGMMINEGYRLDLLINDTIVVEIKSVETLKDVHKKQLLTYLKLMDKKLGLLINFNEPYLKDGVKRIINGHI